VSRHTPEGAGAVSWAILAVGLTLLALAYLILGCGTFGQPTPSKAWSVALTAYTSAARTMAAYCSAPKADEGTCRAAAGASAQTDLVILATEEKLKAGSVSDAELAAATSTLNAVLPLLQRAAGGK
jgi:hypothetical protein